LPLVVLSHRLYFVTQPHRAIRKYKRDPERLRGTMRNKDMHRGLAIGSINTLTKSRTHCIASLTSAVAAESDLDRRSGSWATPLEYCRLRWGRNRYTGTEGAKEPLSVFKLTVRHREVEGRWIVVGQRFVRLGEAAEEV
jgi:hypothetical protein